ncbi:sensor histidine kinase [Acerihabitans sp.]|uniref:sensor histidine kinase n=1 Tax=Acerihabitans sp. TaxID=2811394 RepID=UPI002EDB68ED
MSYVKHLLRSGKPLRLSTSVTLMVCATLTSVLLVVYTLFFIQLGKVAHDSLEEKVFAIARTLADSPPIIGGLQDPERAAAIQPYAERVRQSNNLLFVVVTDMHGIRYSHPEPALIGKHFIGDDLQPALEGKEYHAVNHGALAEALRIFTPVYNDRHQPIGVIALGISLDRVHAVVNENRWSIPWTLLFGILVGALGIWCLVSVVKRIMLGFEPYEIAALFEQRNAMLHSIKEGVIAVDAQARITLINPEAKRLFKKSAPIEILLGGNTDETWALLLNLNTVLKTGLARRDEEINFNGCLLLTNTVPIVVGKQIIGAVATFRDKTEISQLLQRLSGISNYADALRTQSHEFKNKLHVILGMLHMKNYPQLENYILKTANTYQTEIGSLLRTIKSPVMAGFMLGKINRARDLNIRLSINDDSLLPDAQDEQTTVTLITALGNVIENAMEAIGNEENHEIIVSFHHQDEQLHCVVSDDGPGIPASLIPHIFEQGFSTKGENRGLGLSLVKQSVDAVGGTVELESEPGVFTQFFIQLPYKSAVSIL